MNSLNEKDLLSVVNNLRKDGYSHTIEIIDGNFYLIENNKSSRIDDIEIQKGFHFDITENATDSQLLFTALFQNREKKGLIIDLLGANYYSNTPVSNKLNVKTQTYITNNIEKQKYGLTKIYKNEFDANPNRFELRIDFPDFPECPFGFGYKALGYDRVKKEYVWLVTSIIKSEQLEVTRY